MSATSPGRSSWLVCDEITKAFGASAPEPVTVTVIDGQPDLGQRRHVLGPGDAMVRRYGDAVWLIRDGRRSLDQSGRPGGVVGAGFRRGCGVGGAPDEPGVV